ncbi:MAG: hypothetical protein COA79_23105 [Planctomycetota bacterium]|nr:MAG: hypothetical protein COA79_23105 [Planctomycetota bacterium]
MINTDCPTVDITTKLQEVIELVDQLKLENYRLNVQNLKMTNIIKRASRYLLGLDYDVKET